MADFPNLLPAIPELILLFGAILLLLVGVFQGSDSDRSVIWLAELTLIATLGAVLAMEGANVQTFDGMFVADAFARFMKALIVAGAGLTLVMSHGFRERQNMRQFEFPVLVLFATLGMMMMVSANDLMALYVGLELQSLSLYILAAIKRDSQRAAEAGLKYFVLGALSSGLLLYGCSLIYGFGGTTNFDDLAARIAIESDHLGLTIGIVFLLAGLAFKVSAVPFHMWTPDVYEGAPTPITAFFAAAPKIAAIGLLLRVLIEPFGEMVGDWRQVVVFVSIASMVLGAFAAVYQTNIKRLMAYSSIGHIGYALVGLAAGSENGVQAVIVYMAIYLAMTIGTFGCILAMRVKGEMVEGIADLAGLGKYHPLLATGLAALMFSMAGIPPLAGFFGKFYVFRAAVDQGLFPLAIIGVLTSVVAAFYYLRVVKVMFFDDAREPFDRPMGRELSNVIVLCCLFILLLPVFVEPVVASAATAATALYP